MNADGALVLLVVGNLVRGPDVYPSALACCVQQYTVEIRAVDNRIGISKSPSKWLIERNVDDFCSADGIHQLEPVDEDGTFARLIAGTEVVEAVKGIRRDLNPSANFAEFRGLFDDHAIDPNARQPKSGG